MLTARVSFWIGFGVLVSDFGGGGETRVTESGEALGGSEGGKVVGGGKIESGGGFLGRWECVVGSDG